MFRYKMFILMINFSKHLIVDKIEFDEIISNKLTICHLIKFMQCHIIFRKFFSN